MENPKTETEIKSDKYLTRILIGIALIILGVIFLIIALNQPRVNVGRFADNTIKSMSSYNANVSSDNEISNKSNNISDKNSSVSFPINLNTCTAEDLMAIDHVGETRANAIIAYREHLGGYTSVDQLKNISGIGDSVYESIAPYVTV